MTGQTGAEQRVTGQTGADRRVTGQTGLERSGRGETGLSRLWVKTPLPLVVVLLWFSPSSVWVSPLFFCSLISSGRFDWSG